MLAIVLSDALEEVDICRRYPAFYRRLLASPALRRQFLDALAALEAHGAGRLPRGEGIVPRLDFLQRRPDSR